tara:strand:- start:946 stop:2043 length:1098 start_codon:yes stop_codon:yes gene_type:complete
MIFSDKNIAFFQVSLVLLCSLGVWYYTDTIEDTDNDGIIQVTDSNGIIHSFDKYPSRIALTNTYAANVMRMLDVNLSIVVGVSGDFQEEELWPEFVDTPIIQNSAHSEIDFEALLDTRPEIYLVFATNGMVDTNAIREKLEPIGIKVVALDFYKYDVLREEISVIADLFGKQKESTLLFSEFDAIELEVKTRISGLNATERPDVVMEHHASLTRDPVVLTGTSQWTDIIERAGGVNVFKDLPGHTTHVDMEAILDANPDLIMFDGITFDIGFNNFDENDSCGTHMDFIADRPGFDEIDAIINNRMIIMSGEFAGPMMIHGLPTLAKLFHPDLFEDLDTEKYLEDYFTNYHNVNKIGKFVCSSIGS